MSNIDKAFDNLKFKQTQKDPKTAARLEPVNKTHSIVEGIQTRVKDPLWLLGRQWQVGEFRARNGGQVVRAELEVKNRSLNNIVWQEEQTGNVVSEAFDIKVPLEMKVEEEQQVRPGKFRAKCWNPKRLEYSFSIKKDDTELIADEYFGNDLDWYNFDLVNTGNINEVSEFIAVKPTPVSFKGMPLARWWSLEDNQVDLGQIKRPHLNYLTELLMEFSFIYSNDWYVIPLKQKVGCIRRIDKFVVMDSFGIVSKVNPVIDKTRNKQGWEVFTLTPQAKNEYSDGRVFYLPSRLYHALESEPIEKVNFLRDEIANLVWAVEQRYQDKDGNVINRNDEELDQTPVQPKPSLYWDTQENTLVDREQTEGEGEPGGRYIGPAALYQSKAPIPIHWIPFKPRQEDTDGNYILRRSRTVEDLSKGPQYKGVFLSESKYVFEEEVPRTGIMLCRVFQLARDSEGNRYCWRSRKKRPDELHKSSGLQFDYLIEK
jgi:CYTH domain-containing protein